jgi:hypothetical protein
MNWQNKIYENMLEHQFKRGGFKKAQSPRQMTDDELKQTVTKDISAEHGLAKKGKDTSALRKRISGFVKELKKTRGLRDTSR